MKLLLELSKEHQTLPMAELGGVLEGERLKYRILEEHGNLVVLDAKTKDCSFVKRLAMTKRASEILFRSKNLDAIVGDLYDRISNSNSFRVRCTSKVIEKELGRLLHEFGLEVDLRNPDVVVTCDVLKERHFVGIDVPLLRDFEVRKPQHRPYFHPTSMHPKIARTLVNLARVKEGDTLLDPFCGTGGILIEAALNGLSVVGRDIDDRMVAGCRKNLHHYDLEGDISQADALDLSIMADAIVTDPPYGRSSFVSKEPEKLYYRFLANVSKNLRKGGYLVFVSPGSYNLKPVNMNVLEVHDMRVHKSLTRRIWVIKNE